MSDDEHKFILDPEDLPPEAREALFKFLQERGTGDEDTAAFSVVSSLEDLPPELKRHLDRAAAMAAARGDVMAGSPDEGFDIARSYRPGQTQLAITTGDYALSFTTPTVKDAAGDPILLKVLEASDYEQDFPDWEERLHNGYLLCHAEGMKDESDIQHNYQGWFARIDMLPLTGEQATEVAEWLMKGSKPDSVAWMVKTLHKCIDEVNQANGTFLPSYYQCTECGGTNVVADVMQIKRGQFFFGWSEEKNGNYAYSRVLQDDNQFLFARCFDCEHVEDLRQNGMGITHVSGSHFD